MKNRDKKALSRAEKIAQAAAIKAGVISNPRHLIGLPKTTKVAIVGEAAHVWASKYPPEDQDS